MEVIKEFISTYGATIVYTILTAIITFIGTKINETYQKMLPMKQKEKLLKQWLQLSNNYMLI